MRRCQSSFKGRLISGVLTFALALACRAADPAFAAKVVGVHDGDSLTVYDGKHPSIKIRLASIDAPELGQLYGVQAKAELSGLVFGKEVTVAPTGKDRYGRTLADVRIGDVWVNLRMVEAGAAWRFNRYSKDAALLAAQQHAAKSLVGLWDLPGPIPPWLWRKNKGAASIPGSGLEMSRTFEATDARRYFRLVVE